MAKLLRKHYQCFYCGQKTKQSLPTGLRQWQCESCEAVNYLDSSGEITDPPATHGPSSSLRYARKAQRSVSPTFIPLNDSLFCAECLKNQHLLAQNLADYLPDPGDPQYAHYEEKYPEYRRNLEKRYPQVCERCEPRVRQRIQTTGYAAKTDHLRRLMENTRGAMHAPQAVGWRYFFVRLGAAGWWFGLLAQVSWHLVGFCTAAEFEGLGEPNINIFSDFVPGGLKYFTINDKFNNTASFVGLLGLILAIASIWWNPTMLSGPTRRATGLTEYYKLQIILNLVRIICRYVLVDGARSGVSPPAISVIHLTILLFNILVSIISYRTPRISSNPQISFHDDVDPIPLHSHGSQTKDTHSIFSNVASTTSTFPINRLGIAQHRAEIASIPPTPPADDDEDSDANESIVTNGDAMDIDTPEDEFQSLPQAIQWPSSTSPEPSPFHGRLPAAPVGPAHKLRNPPNRPSFQRASPRQQEAFSRGFGRSNVSVPPALNEANAASNPSGNMEMAAPRFYATSERNNETGLESIFSGFFSLGEEPVETRGAHQEQTTQVEIPKDQLWNNESIRHLLPTATMTLICSGFLWAQKQPGNLSAFLPAGLGVAAFVTAFHLYDALGYSRKVWVLSDILVFLGELVLAVYGLYEISQSSNHEDSLEKSTSFPSLWLFGILFLQETWFTITHFRKMKAVNANRSIVAQGHTGLSEAASRAQNGTASSSSDSTSYAASKSGGATQAPAFGSVTTKSTQVMNSQAHSKSGGAATGLASLNLGFTEPETTQHTNGSWQGRRLRRQVAPWEVGSL